MYEAKDFSHLLGTEGFSDELLNNHFKLYQGYVKNTSNAVELMKKHGAGTYEYGEIKRRFGWEFSGMRLHEYYFGNMTKDNQSMDLTSDLAEKIEKSFGSADAWMEDFKGTGSMRGIGWVVCSYDKIGDQVFNAWINEHDLGHLAGTQPLLVMDVFEHAFVTDYGLNKGDYIKAFTKAIDWKAVNERFSQG
jgi:Fe-Mn family superoxide dismutase